MSGPRKGHWNIQSLLRPPRGLVASIYNEFGQLLIEIMIDVPQVVVVIVVPKIIVVADVVLVIILLLLSILIVSMVVMHSVIVFVIFPSFLVSN